MDIDDVSGTAQLVAAFSKQEQTLEAAKKRKGKRPKNMKPRDLLIHEFMMIRSSQKMYKLNQTHVIHQSWFAEPYPPSVAPLSTLKKLHIDEMELETHHRGSYALLRVITPSNTMNAVMVIVEDEKEHVVMVQVYQQEDTEYELAENIAQVGGVCIVKEPYFKTNSDGGYGIRVDHVTDIVWVAQDDDKVPLGWQARISEVDKTAEGLKAEGNAALKARDLPRAINWYAIIFVPFSCILTTLYRTSYNKALRCAATTEEIQIIKLNRSLANIKLRRYEQALADAIHLSEGYKMSVKGFYRAARSLYELQRFQECRETLIHLLDNYPNNLEARQELLCTERRLKEQEYGDYDFMTMYKSAEETPPHVDNATFVGPVTIKASKGRGRGLFTTKSVVAGELLLCEKAFSYCHASREEGAIASKTSMLLNTHTKRAAMGTQADLITAIVQKMSRNPSLMASFTALHHGDYKPVKEKEVDDLPIVDT